MADPGQRSDNIANSTVPEGSTEAWRDKKRYLWLIGLVVPSLAFVAAGAYIATGWGAWLWIGDQQIHLLELPNPDPVEGRPAHGGRDRHLALTIDDLDALARVLDAAGIGYTRSRSGRRALFFRDPDGNALELIEIS